MYALELQSTKVVSPGGNGGWRNFNFKGDFGKQNGVFNLGGCLSDFGYFDFPLPIC